MVFTVGSQLALPSSPRLETGVPAPAEGAHNHQHSSVGYLHI